MQAVLSLAFAAILCGVSLAAEAERTAEEGITVSVVGTLTTGVIAIGGETTGTTIKVKGIVWELDFGKNDDLRKAAETLNGKKVLVQGSLERRAGVEVKLRWIVTVKSLVPGSSEPDKSPDKKFFQGVDDRKTLQLLCITSESNSLVA